MQPTDLLALTDRAPDMESEDARFWIFGQANGHNLWVGRYVGSSPWTLHPDDDALMQTVQGEATVTLRREGGDITHAMPAGSVFVVPKGTWYRSAAEQEITMFGVCGRTESTPGDPPAPA